MNDGLGRRVAKLERENRLLRMGGLIVILLALSGILMGQNAPDVVPDVIKAQSFMLVDKKGNVRAALHLPGEDTVHLSFWDKELKERVQLSLSPDGISRLLLRDQLGNIRALVVVDKGGSPIMMLLDEKGKGIWRVP